MAFITVQDWMVKNFNLKGNELLAYALIYGFSQEGESEFKGSISYISEWLNTSKSTTMRILKKLIEMGVIKKRTVTINGMIINNYTAVMPEEYEKSQNDTGGVKITPGVSKCDEGGIKMTGGRCQNDTKTGVKMTPHNIYNIDNNIKDNIVCGTHTQESSKNVDKKPRKIFRPPTTQEVREYCLERGNDIDAEYFVNFYQSKNWMVGKNKMKDWRACVRTWEIKNRQNQKQRATPSSNSNNSFHNFEQRDYDFVELEQRLAGRHV